MNRNSIFLGKFKHKINLRGKISKIIPTISRKLSVIIYISSIYLLEWKSKMIDNKMQFDHIGIVASGLAIGRKHFTEIYGVNKWSKEYTDLINGVYIQFFENIFSIDDWESCSTCLHN